MKVGQLSLSRFRAGTRELIPRIPVGGSTPSLPTKSLLITMLVCIYLINGTCLASNCNARQKMVTPLPTREQRAQGGPFLKLIV